MTSAFVRHCLLAANNSVSTVFSLQHVRTKIRYSLEDGKPKTVHAVVERFYRLHWGIWIRPKPGRHKKIWKKSEAQMVQQPYHVFCNKQQSKLLDKMVCSEWKTKKYWVDTPYDVYQQRPTFPFYYGQRSRPFFP